MDLLAQPALRTNAEAIADDEHSDHQLGIDRGSAYLAVKRPQRLAEIIEGEMAVNAPEQVIERDVVVEAEIIDSRADVP